MFVFIFQKLVGIVLIPQKAQNELFIDVLSNRFSLTHFMPRVSFYTPWKQQKTSGFLMFSGGIERD